MATATWTITEDDVYGLLQLASQFNNEIDTLEFEADAIPSALLTTLVEELLALYETKNADFEPWGRKLARWANISVPIVVEAIAEELAGTTRVTESGDVRVSEDGSKRLIED